MKAFFEGFYEESFRKNTMIFFSGYGRIETVHEKREEVFMKLRVFHTVNSGMYLWNGRSGLLIDALHGGKNTGFSDTPKRYIQMMEKKESFFGQPNDLLFTHTHEDHYDLELVEQFLKLNPESSIYGPQLDQSNIQPTALGTGVGVLKIRNYTVYTFTTEHDGTPFTGYPHCSYLIRSGEQSLWISGDAMLQASLASQVKEISGVEYVDAAFVMVYQIGRKPGKEFLRALSPEHIYLYHLPYTEDDTYQYCQMAKNLIGRCLERGLEVTALEHDSYVDI